MDSIPGDRWIGDYARWLRVHEARLGDVAASAAAAKRNAAVKTERDTPAATLSSTFWNVVGLGSAGTPSNGSPSSAATRSSPMARPMLLRQNPHNLYYLLIRFEELGLPVGSLDTRIPIAARPTSYFSFVAATAADKDRDDTMSMRSMRSRMSVVSSSLSSSLSWFGSNVAPDPCKDVKYIYSCFTKIPSLRLGPIPARKLIQDFEDCPGQSAVPLDVFKNLQTLELDDVDPRTLLGWDRACIQLRSLTCKKSNIEDITDVLVDLVVLDTKRRRGEKLDARRLRRAAVSADAEQDTSTSDATATNTNTKDNAVKAQVTASTSDQAAAVKESTPTLPADLPSLAWHFLRYLNLCSNNLTFVPVEPLLCLSGVTNLDLSSNLLNVVPPSLCHLPALTSLNISDNLIDSVLGIYDALPAIRALNLAKNRLESLCGLERLFTLERIDLRGNAIYEAGEVGRLAPLTKIQEVWVKDNPLVEELVDYRVECFAEFAMEAKTVVLDGEAAGFFERQRIVERVPNAAALWSGGRLGDTQERDSARGAKSHGEQDEAQLAKDVATTSNTLVKNVRHRAAGRPANVDRGRGGDSLRVSGNSIAGGLKTRSRSNSRNREDPRTRGTSNNAQGARRRNQRVVELDSSPQKPSATNRQRTLTDSDRIKHAVLAGNSSAALDDDEQAKADKEDNTGEGKVAGTAKAESGRQRAGAEKGRLETSTDQAAGAASTMALALVPNVCVSDSTTRARERQGRLTSGRNPIDSSTLGRKSAARPVASDLFAPRSSAVGNTDASRTSENAEMLVRERIARPRTGSSAALARRSRVTTSLYEPDLERAISGLRVDGDRNGGDQENDIRSIASAGASTTQSHTNASRGGNTGDAFRRRIEALKSEVGDDWLRLLARGGGADRESLMLLGSVSEDQAESRNTEEQQDVSTPTTAQIHNNTDVARIRRKKSSTIRGTAPTT